MEKRKYYFRHCIINSSDQDEVEREIDGIYNDEYSEVISMTITPLRFGGEELAIPSGYDICYVYADRYYPDDIPEEDD